MRILVVGQGLAGCLMAWALRQRGAEVWVTDRTGPLPAVGITSSSVAAGLIVPVTGKRYVKTWMWDVFFPAARQLYQAIEQQYGIRLWYEMPLVRLLGSTEEVNNWCARESLEEYGALLTLRQDAGPWTSLLHGTHHYGWMPQAARVDFMQLMHTLRSEAIESGYWTEAFPREQTSDVAEAYDHLVFCEGAAGEDNPWFPDLPWQIAKGEACIIRPDCSDAAAINSILKKNIAVVPVGTGRFWCGATFEWQFSDAQPTAQRQQELRAQLDAVLQVPYVVEQPLAAIRPTTGDRRPFILQSPLHPRLWMLNGLGSKGALLAPSLAQQLAAKILETRL